MYQVTVTFHNIQRNHEGKERFLEGWELLLPSGTAIGVLDHVELENSLLVCDSAW